MKPAFRGYPPIAILGGGIAGLTAAAHLKHHNVPFTLFEGSKAVAGLMQSERDEDGFTYDCGAHFVTNRLAAAVGVASQCRPMTRYGETVYLRGKNYSYPFGLMRSPRFSSSAILAKSKGFLSKKAVSAADHFRNQYGRRLADEVAIPLTEAWSGYEVSQVAASVAQKFATGLPRVAMLKTAAWMTKRVIGVGYSGTITESTNSWHVYPNGGIAKICTALADEVADDVQLNSKVEQIQVENDTVVGVKVSGVEYETAGVISTAPVHALANMTAGTNQLETLKQFQYRAMVFVNLKLEGPTGLSDVVTWVPERRFPFFRISDIGMGLPFLVPEGKSHVTCDIGCKIGDEVWAADDDLLTKRCLEGLEEISPGISERCFGSRVVRVPLAYPIFRLAYEEARHKFATQGTGVKGLLCVGRNGEFAHILMEDVFWRTRWKVSQFMDEHELV